MFRHEQDFYQTTERLEKAIQGGLKRNLNREELPWNCFDSSLLTDNMIGALGFLVSQLVYFESYSPKNLSMLATATPIQALRNAYATQIHDEVAHGQILRKYLMQKLRQPLQIHRTTKFASSGGLIVQCDPLAGSVAVMAGIEFFAVEVLAALKKQVDEPLLLAIISHIEKDEFRHKVIAVESARVLSKTRLTNGRISKARTKILRKGVELFFKEITCKVFAKHVTPLGLNPLDLYERSLDEMSDVFANELGAEGIWTGLF